MKKLFQAIRQGDFDTVKQLLEKKPELISCTAKQPPKKDDGQSPLQVAIKAGRFDIADYLLELGADVNFIESESCCNEWRAPVIHDAINAAVMCSRWNVVYDELKTANSRERADAAYRILEKIVGLGADVNAMDSYGNSCLWRFCLQARQILPSVRQTDRVLTPELHRDLSRIAALLSANGMDMSYIPPSCQLTAAQMYAAEPLAQFLNM